MKVNLRPDVLDLLMYSGDARAIEVEPVDDNEAPADLSDRTWAAQWRPFRGATSKVDLEVDDSAAATGSIVVHFRSEATRQFAVQGVWDVQGLDGDDQALTLMTGKVTMQGDVTPEEETS